MATGVDLGKCNSVGAWFGAENPAYWLGDMTQETCGTGPKTQNLSYGCGKDGRTGYKMCGGFPRGLDTNISGWDSLNGSIDNTSNNNPNRGVLCVKP
mgnify:CR=1 FL=1